MIKLWLDDVRRCPFVGSEWMIAKDYDQAITILSDNEVEEAWIDHDLAPDHRNEQNEDPGYVSPNKSGYDVVVWMKENNKFPSRSCLVHSLNPVGSDRMCEIIAEHYKSQNKNKHRIPFTQIQRYLQVSMKEN